MRDKIQIYRQPMTESSRNLKKTRREKTEVTRRKDLQKSKMEKLGN